jgi:molecular chaperone GrpE
MTERPVTGDDQARVKVVNKRILDPEGERGAQARGAETPGEPAAAGDLAQARAEAAQYLDDLQRLKAEFENFRKRTAREQAAMGERASAAMVERLIPILDNFELALLAADRTKDYEAMVRGVELVYGQLQETLRKEGLERIESLHQPFDPERHEAVMHEPGDDGEGEHVVVDEMRPGYSFGGRVVRPAMVKVGKKKQ